MLMEKEIDKQPREAVLGLVEWAPEIASQDISAEAKDGTEMLSGFVHNCVEKVATERLANSVNRERALANGSEARPLTHTNPKIARDVVHALALDVTVPAERVKMIVRGDKITLEGSVDWHGQTEDAKSMVRDLLFLCWGIPFMDTAKPNHSPIGEIANAVAVVDHGHVVP